MLVSGFWDWDLGARVPRLCTMYSFGTSQAKMGCGVEELRIWVCMSMPVLKDRFHSMCG